MAKRKPRKATKKKGNIGLIAGVVGIILLAGIVYGLSNNSPGEDETTDNKIKLPSYAYTNPLTLKAYTYATEHPEVLEQIPCYCGCGSMGHRFLRDCFINDDRTYDEHASFCDVCVGENNKVQQYLASGMTLKEVRAKIDGEYVKYIDGKTDTPPVSDNYQPILVAKI